MHKLYLLFLIPLLLLSSCNTAEENGKPKVQFSFKEDGRKWKEARKTKNDTQELVEYILDGENEASRTELVTIQYFYGLKLDIPNFFQSFIEQLKQNAPENKIESRVISQDQQGLLGEWWIEDNTSLDQHEWVRILAKDDTLAIIRYTTKNKEEDKHPMIWENILQKATL